MPTYQYRCTECGSEIERVQKFSDAALTTCEDCGGTLRKVYNAVGIVFKGSGFYHNDSKSKSKSNLTSTSSPASTSSGESSSPSSSADSSKTSMDSSTTTKPAVTAPGRSA